MIDRGTVIEALEHCSDRTQQLCNPTCPYHELVFCETELAKDALELLKEQQNSFETVSTIYKIAHEFMMNNAC